MHLELFPICAACGEADGLEVHHRKPVHLFPELELEPSNLITLCEKRGCHFRIGHSFDWRAYNPSVQEDAETQWRRIAERIDE